MGLRSRLRRVPALNRLTVPVLNGTTEKLQEGRIDEQNTAMRIAFNRGIRPSPELGGKDVVR
jgi:hypothetical protein